MVSADFRQEDRRRRSAASLTGIAWPNGDNQSGNLMMKGSEAEDARLRMAVAKAPPSSVPAYLPGVGMVYIS